MNDKAAIGIVLMIIVTICLPVHLTILWLFVSRKDYRKLVAYRIMLSLGIMECLHLVAHFMTGVMTLCQSGITVWLERITGALILSSWIGMVGMIFTLALNRAIVLTGVRLHLIEETTVFNALMALIWLSYASVIGLHMTDDGAVNYRIRESSFSYKLEGINDVLERYESYVILIFLSCSFVLYVGIVIWILLNKNFRLQHVKMERHELRILAQAIVIFVYLTTLRSIWHWGPGWYLKNVAVVDVMNILTSMIGGVNPILYLTFNKSVQRDFFSLLPLRSVKKFIEERFSTTNVIHVQPSIASLSVNSGNF